MEKNDYRIVLLGIQSDKDPDDVKIRLAEAFHAPPEKIGQLLSKFPVIVKSGVDYQSAMKYQDVIGKAGGICRVDSIEDLGHTTAPLPKSAPTIKTCPNCGYHATTPDDPLLTAHDGLGECPACGIIVAKFSDKRDMSILGSMPVQEEAGKAPTFLGSILSSMVSRPWISLLMVAAVAVLAVNLFSRMKGDRNGAPDSALPTQSKKESAKNRKDPNSVAVLKILPGETRDVLLTTYLDFLHRDSYSPLSITPHSSIENKWEEEGVLVEIRNVKVVPLNVSLWEHYGAKDDFWAPAGYREISSQGGSYRKIEKGKNLLTTPFPAALVKKPEETSMKIDAADPDFRKSTYTMYRLECELSISVSSGPEFGARDLTITTEDGKTFPRKEREGNFCINTYVEWDLDSNAEALLPSNSFARSGSWKATKASILKTKKVYVDMKHVSRTEGLTISPREKFCESAMYCELEML